MRFKRAKVEQQRLNGSFKAEACLNSFNIMIANPSISKFLKNVPNTKLIL